MHFTLVTIPSSPFFIISLISSPALYAIFTELATSLSITGPDMVMNENDSGTSQAGACIYTECRKILIV